MDKFNSPKKMRCQQELWRLLGCTPSKIPNERWIVMTWETLTGSYQQTFKDELILFFCWIVKKAGDFYFSYAKDKSARKQSGNIEVKTAKVREIFANAFDMMNCAAPMCLPDLIEEVRARGFIVISEDDFCSLTAAGKTSATRYSMVVKWREQGLPEEEIWKLLPRKIENETAKTATKIGACEPKKKSRNRHKISAAAAATACKKSKRTVERWLAGKNTPDDFPGLDDTGVFLAWAETYKGRKAIFSGKHKTGNTQKTKGRHDVIMADNETDT